MGQNYARVVPMRVVPIAKITVFSSSQNWSNYKKEIAADEASLGSEEAALKTLQDQMAALTERLEAIKSQGEQARIQEQGLSSLISKLVSKLKNWKLFGNPRRGNRSSF